MTNELLKHLCEMKCDISEGGTENIEIKHEDKTYDVNIFKVVNYYPGDIDTPGTGTIELTILDYEVI